MPKAIIVSKERTIDTPVEKVWEWLEPAGQMAKWFPSGVYSERINGEGKGRKQLLFVKWGKKEAEFVQEIIEYEINKRIKWKHLKEIWNGKEKTGDSRETFFSIELFPQGEKTRILLQTENIPWNAWKSIVFKWVARPRTAKMLVKALVNIENGIRSPQPPQKSLMDALL
jgi:uncharacterized protein YndB with AHSA1/START domain